MGLPSKETLSRALHTKSVRQFVSHGFRRPSAREFTKRTAIPSAEPFLEPLESSRTDFSDGVTGTGGDIWNAAVQNELVPNDEGYATLRDSEGIQSFGVHLIFSGIDEFTTKDSRVRRLFFWRGEGDRKVRIPIDIRQIDWFKKTGHLEAEEFQQRIFNEEPWRS